MTGAENDAPGWERTFDLCMSPSAPTVAEEAHYTARALGLEAGQAEALVESIVEQIEWPLPPLSLLELFLTDRCNLACPYCFVEGKQDSRRMSLAMAQAAFDFFLRESGPVEELSLVLMGGEPMLEFEMLRMFLPWAATRARTRSKRLRINMTTNGTLIDPEKARILGELGVKVLVSVDGSEATHDRRRPTRDGKGSFAAVRAGLKSLRLHQGLLGAKVTVVPGDAAALLENVMSLWRGGVGYLQIGPATGIAWTAEAAEMFYNSLRSVFEWWHHLASDERPRIPFFERAGAGGERRSRRHLYGCRAGRNGVVISPGGEIYPCSKVLGVNGLRGILRLGSIEEGFTERHTRLALNGLGTIVRSACWNCAWQGRCMGGCYAVNYLQTGDPFRPGPDCRMIVLMKSLEQEIRTAMDDEVGPGGLARGRGA